MLSAVIGADLVIRFGPKKSRRGEEPEGTLPRRLTDQRRLPVGTGLRFDKSSESASGRMNGHTTQITPLK